MSDIIFKALFEHASLGIIISNEEGVIEQANAFMSKIFGYREHELIGQKVEIFLPKQLKESHVALRHGYNQNPSHRPMGVGMDLKAVKKDGQEIPVEVSISYYEINGHLHIINFISDITDRKKAEIELHKLMGELEEKVQERTQELSHALIELNHINSNLSQEVEQRKKAEEKTREALEREKEFSEMKSRFVSMASHEFRTPLGGILTSASLIGRYKTSEDEPKRQKHIHTIKKSVKNLTTILNDFLSLDKLEQGKVGACPSSFQFNQFVKNTIAEIKDLLDDEQDLSYDSSFDDVKVYQDQDMLRNVLINLLSNAIKYSPEKSPIDIQSSIRDNFLHISIKDYGFGIPENEQKHIFTRFFRAHNASTIQGTGLGLNIVKRYLNLMGGDIHFESQENKGTTFFVRFPLELENENDSTD